MSAKYDVTARYAASKTPGPRQKRRMEDGKYANRQETHRYSAADEEREDEGHDVVVRCPEVDVNCIKDTEQGEPP